LKKNSIAVVKQMLETEEISKELLEDLKNDERKGIQTLIERYEKKEQKKRQQLERYQQMLWPARL
jgi:ribonuclease HII